MRILVTGGAGFIGSHVVDAYVAGGHEVRVIDNLATGRRANVNAKARLHEIDVHSNETGQLFREFRPEIVNHHAAQASVKLSASDPQHDLEVNGGGTARIAFLAAQFGARKMIYSSTGGALYGDPERVPVDEEHPIRPLSAYGLSKRVGELYLDLAGRTLGLTHTILRYANAYGPRQDPHGEAGVVAIFTGKMLRGEPCTIDGDGEQEKDYVYVGDIARANVIALEKGDGQALNIGTGRGTSVNAIFGALQRATGDTTAPLHGPPRPGDVRRIWLDSARAKRVLGWEPEVDLDDGIARTVEWFRANS
ncbi:MAG: NAD-dependent epimerase/dehydratase family protein [Dehalococcoidia bacterium]|nr:MAG: NAD-dependent epimerase/dehydratase family protein [bacterium]MCE7928256.1 NAD-dependent epimerase/dehydratase family protein [Chloroflexi bacterium CFX7]MCK6565896.1 NAD-dependent epimerase/dehydratase family protein [Dehalococcoidia bacterium]MCL4231384.1 NAD-dependent epimerase/dehydratase family protein [Dehalococcoidia bacterium]NUQ56372.1 NAD-dependent epimerase/dehydratase family protein [Dehalococcoidia bacterium]